MFATIEVPQAEKNKQTNKQKNLFRLVEKPGLKQGYKCHKSFIEKVHKPNSFSLSYFCGYYVDMSNSIDIWQVEWIDLWF